MPVAVRSKSCLIDMTAGSNPSEGVVVGVLCFFYVVHLADSATN
jgi:hypothetical protein